MQNFLTRRAFLGRTAMLGMASSLPVGLLTACGGSGSGTQSTSGGSSAQAVANASPSAPAAGDLTLTATIAGQSVGRAQVLEWEANRLQVVAQRMKNNLPASKLLDLEALLLRPSTSIANIDAERQQLVAAKINAGDDAMMQLVASDLAISGPAMSVAALVGQWSVCQIEIASNRGTAEGFAEWFTSQGIKQDNERAMLVACPDHYLIRALGTDGQNVVEETGGALLVSHFTIDYAVQGTLPYSIDPAFPVRLMGPASSPNSTEQVGGVLHQFRTLDSGGFVARPAVFFPAALPFWFVTEHRWHLACEFSNWITAYVEETGA